MTAKPVVVVGGPTAGGKSVLALAVAEEFGGTVINADSMQIYRDLKILTARPEAAALRRAPHRLYGLLKADERCTAGRWRRMALPEIRGARVPVVVGGTGLYLRALVDGLDEIPEIPEAVRRRLEERLAAEGPAALHRELELRDPETARRLAPGDRQRISRALEVLDHTGRGLARWQTGDAATGEFRFFTIVVMPNRERLFAACDARFRRMVEAGAVEEIRRLADMSAAAGSPLWKAIGAEPIRKFLEGSVSRDEMFERAQRDTRRYAKRQITWFRNQVAADRLVCGSDPGRAFPDLARFLLT